jgi:nicotinate-nucleotide adenylyltransferase
MYIHELLVKTANKYYSVFGRTPLKERLKDIHKQAEELSRAPDIDKMREKASNLFGSLMQFCNETHMDPEELIQENLTLIQRRELQYSTLGRRKKVAILGGAFDPITIGHTKVLEFVLNCSGIFDEAWVMPCHAHMHGKKMTSTEHRLEMCKIATKENDRLHVFDFEIKHKLQGETYKVIKALLDYDEQYEFSFIIGQDNANNFDKWVNYDLLERMIRFVVVPRKGEARDDSVDWYLKTPHIYMSPDNSIPEISSTQIRAALKEYQKNFFKKKNTRNFIVQNMHPKVLDYIKQNNLYC